MQVSEGPLGVKLAKFLELFFFDKLDCLRTLSVMEALHLWFHLLGLFEKNASSVSFIDSCFRCEYYYYY